MSDTDHIREREFTRNRVHVQATVHAPDGHVIPGHTEELSMNGLFVRCDEWLPEDSRCHVTLTLGDDEARIEVAARVANVTDSGMGLAFDEMDPESFAHLKRLVLYNAADPDRVEAEIENHLGFKERIHP
jgi:hypothetical protein